MVQAICGLPLKDDGHAHYKANSSTARPQTQTTIWEFLSLSYGTTVKSKAIPLQAWTGPEGSRKLRLGDFKTIGT
jgi:hypothetical protein